MKSSDTSHESHFNHNQNRDVVPSNTASSLSRFAQVQRKVWLGMLLLAAASFARVECRAQTVVGWGPITVPANLAGVISISAGTSHALALKSDGTVVAFGDNSGGQTNVPTGLSGVVAVAGGYSHSLALKSDGTVVAWGGNNSGQATVPAGLTGVRAIAAGYYHSLALKSDGTVTTWGDNGYGQRAVPAGLTGVTAIAAGYTFSLALKSDGTVIAWGDNGHGETTIPSGLTGVTAISANNKFAMALKSDGTVVAWGLNTDGEATVPAGLTGVSSIAAGVASGYALKTDGTVVAWGLNTQSQTNVPAGLSGVSAISAGSFALALQGVGPSAQGPGIGLGWGYDNLQAAEVPARRYKAIAGGFSHGLALKADGTVVGWGDNGHGETTIPAGLTGVTAISGGAYFSVALKSDGTVVAWGDNSRGQTTIPSGLTGVKSIAAGVNYVLALKSDGTVVAWGANDFNAATVPAGLTGVIAIAAYNHSLALKSDGTLVAWGYAYYNLSSIPPTATGVTAIAVGQSHSVALRSDGTVVAWGDNTNGQTNTPAGLTGVIAIAAASSASFALKSDGTVAAWGDNLYGETTVPTGLAGVTAVAGGGYSGYVLTTAMPILSLSVTHSGFTVGQIGTYTLSVSNSGPVPITGATVTLSDPLPAGFTVSNIVTTADWDCSTSTTTSVLCTSTKVVGAGGSFANITVNVTPDITSGTTNVVNTATVTDGASSASGSDTSSVVHGPVFSVTLTDSGSGTFTQGDNGRTFTATVNNTSGSSTSGQTTLVFSPSDASALVPSYSNAGGWTCSGSGVITCNNSSVVSVGSSFTPFVLSVNVAANATSPQTMTATASGGGAGSSATASDMLTILKTQSISFTQPADHTLGDVPFALVATATSGLTVTFASNSTSVCTVSGSQVTVIAIGICSISADQAGNGSYSVAPTVTKTFNVGRTGQTISFTQPADHTYGDAAFGLVATATSGLTVTFTSNSLAICTVSGTQVTLVGGGVCSISADQSGNASYSAATTVTKTFNVGKANQTINFSQPADHALSDPSFSLAASATSSLAVVFTSNSTAVCTVSGAQVTLVATGICSISADQAGNGNYAAAPTVTKTFNVGKTTQTIIFTQPADHTFGDAAFGLVATASSGLTVTFTSNSSAVCTVSGSTVTIVSGGACSISADQGGNATYGAAPTVTKTFNVGKASQTINFTQPADHTFGDSTFGVVAAATSSLTVTFTSNSTAVCTISGTTVTILSGGICSISADQAGNTNYSAAPTVTKTFNIGKASQSISFTQPADHTFGDAPFGVVASATSSLTVTFTSNSAGVCTVSGSTVTLVGAGICSISADQAGNVSYLAAVQATRTFNVGKASQTITFTQPLDHSYGDAPFGLAASAGSSLTVTFTSNSPSICTVSGSTVTLVAGGICSISADQAGNTNYSAASTVTKTFNVGKTSQTISFTQPVDHTFGDSAFGLIASATSSLAVVFSSNSTAVCTVSGSSVTLVSGGICSISADQAGNANYSAAPTVTKTFNVGKAGQTITFTQPVDHTFGDAPFGVVASATSSLTVTFTSNSPSVCTVSGSTITVVGGGVCSISADQAGNANYSAATTVTKTLNVGKAGQTISFTQPADHAPGDAPFGLVATATSGLTVAFSSTSPGICTVSGAFVTIVSSGVCSISADQAGNTNYAAAPTVVKTFNIAKYNQSISFTNPGTQIYLAVINLTASATSGLTVTFASTTPSICTVSGTQATMIAGGQCSIQATQAGNSNYNAATPVTQSFNVGAADLTVTMAHVGHFSQGQTDATYTITVANSGIGPTNGSAVTVTGTLPAGMTAVSMAGLGWICSVGTVTCTRSDSLSGGLSYSPITLLVSVSPSAGATLTNQVKVAGGGEINTSNDSASDPATIYPITDVSRQVSVVQNGFGRNRTTGLWSATMTVTNTGSTPLQGPIQVVLTNLTAGVTMTDNSGVRNGSPYITVVPSAQTLPPGAMVNVTIQFSNPSGGIINFTPVTDLGVF